MKITKNMLNFHLHFSHILFMKVSVLYFTVDLKVTWCNVLNKKYIPKDSRTVEHNFPLFR